MHCTDCRFHVGSAGPGPRFLVVTGDHDPARTLALFQRGCWVLHKPVRPTALLDGVRRLLSAPDPVAAFAAKHRLSPRETEVLQLISEGNKTREIASKLHISVKTVEIHRRNIMEKLNIHSIAGLTKFAIQEGYTTLNT